MRRLFSIVAAIGLLAGCHSSPNRLGAPTPTAAVAAATATPTSSGQAKDPDQTHELVGEFRISPAPDGLGVIRLPPGGTVKVNAASFRQGDASSLGLSVAWGDSEESNVPCGICRAEHAYSGGSPFTLTATIGNGAASRSQSWTVRTLSVVATVALPAGAIPIALAVDSAQHRLYVANWIGGNVLVVDTTTNTMIGSISLTGGSQPRAVAIDASLGKVYVPDSTTDSVFVIDTATSAVTAVIPVGDLPVGVCVDPMTHEVYVTNALSNTLSIIDGLTNTVTGTVAVGTAPSGVDVDPVTRRVYVADNNSFLVTVVDAATRTVAGTVFSGARPVGVAVDPIRHGAYVTNGDDSFVSVIDSTNTVVDRIFVGGGIALPTPFGVAVDVTAQLVYIVVQGENGIEVVDRATNTVLSKVPTGPSPDSVVVDPLSHTVYVGNGTDGTISVIQ